MRILIQTAVEVVRERHWEGAPKVIIEAPTGYGKSVSGPLFFKELVDMGLAESLIHVLPLRAILRDLYLCTLLASKTDKPPAICRDKSPPPDVREALASLSHEEIAYQMGELIIGDDINFPTRKSPLYDAKYVVTTIDSFLYNFFRIPVTEITSRKKHYAIPRLRIMISGVYLDEAHLVFEEENEASSIYTATLKAIEVLAIYKVPLIIASATLGEKAVNEICSRFRDKCVVVRLGSECRNTLQSENTRIIEVADKDFADRMASVKWITSFIDENTVVENAISMADSGQRVLIVRDRVGLAVDTYKVIAHKLGGDKVTLIHGLMTRGDREKALDTILGSRETRIVVSTSVIEAGLNVSFDALITDGSRPRSVVQRAGRVCRYGECEEAKVYLVKNQMLDERLHDFVSNHERICWRLPFDYSEYKGYGVLMNALDPPDEDIDLKRKLDTLVNSLFVSYRTINDILRDTNYALVRTGIVEVLIGGLDLVNEGHVKYEDLVNNSLVLDISKVNDLIKKDCIDGVIAAYADSDSNIYEVSSVCESNELIRNTGYHSSSVGSTREFDLRKYISCIKRANETFSGNIVYTAISVKSECYEKSMGLVKIAQR